MKMALQPTVDPQPTLARRAIRAWNWFWFTAADPLPLGVMRICGGLILTYVTLAYTSDLQEFFGTEAWLNLETANDFRWTFPWGAPAMDFKRPAPLPDPTSAEEREYIQQYWNRWLVDPRLVYAQGNPYWSIWFHVTDPAAMLAIHYAMIGIMVLFTIGFCTRVTSVLSWLALLCYVQRSPGTVFGMDAIMNVVIFYLMIAPSGAALSVDRLIGRYWTTWRALRRQRPAPPLARPAPMVSANMVLRMMQIHFCFIYLASGTSKLLGSTWWNGTALWYIMANYEFTPLRFSWYFDLVNFLCHHRVLWEVMLSGGVVYTLALEISFPFLVWFPRLRGVMIAASAILHFSIALTMGLMTFGLIMITLLIAFVPAELLRRVLQVLLGQNGPHVLLRFDSRVGWQTKVASLVRAFDAVEQVEVVDMAAVPARRPGDSRAIQEKATAEAAEHRLQLVTPAGEVRTGYELFENLTRSLRPLWPAAAWTWVPGVGQPGHARRRSSHRL